MNAGTQNIRFKDVAGSNTMTLTSGGL